MTVENAAAPPWLRQYRDLPSDLSPSHASALDMFRATLARDGDAPLVYYFDTAVTARTVDEMSDALAVAFADQGIGVGDRVAMYLQNVPEAVVTVVAAWKCGAVLVPCNPMLRERELKKILVDSGCRVLVCHDDLYEDVAAPILEATAVERVFTTSPLDLIAGKSPGLLADHHRREALGSTSIPYIVAANRGRLAPEVKLAGDDVALMVYTSGTTGAPKGATNTHRNVVFATSVYESWLRLDANDVILGIAPLFHVTGLIGHISLTLLTGAPLILFYRFDADEACRMAEAHRATFTVSAVTAFIALLNSGALARYDLSSLTKFYTGGAPTPPASLREWKEKAGSTLHPMYGLTEATSPTHMTPFGETPPVDKRSGSVSVGVPVFGTNVRVVGENGHEAPVGEIGELFISGPQIVPGYWQKPDETQASFTQGELHTGDIGFMDEAGWFYLVDRAKDMIVASGFKVWPREVEDVLYEHPAIREAAVIGIPDPYRGETVKALVSLKPGATATVDEIKAFARERVAAYKYPRVVEIMDELPKTTSGKILRNELRNKEQAPPPPLVRPSISSVSYAELQDALEARAVIELGATWLVLGHGTVPVGRAVGLYERLERMLTQVYADGRFIDREAFLNANHEYHEYLINLADNRRLTKAFDSLQLRRLFGELLSNSDATSEQVVLQHERLTDAVAAQSLEGATEAIIAWAAAADRHVKSTLGGSVEHERKRREPGDSPEPTLPTSGTELRAALAEGLQAQVVLEVGVLKLIQNDDESRRLSAALVARSPLVRGLGPNRLSELARADHEFHRALIGALGNPLILDFYESLDLLRLTEAISTQAPEHMRVLIEDRSALVSALRDGDIERAIAAVDDQSAQLRGILLGRASD